MRDYVGSERIVVRGLERLVDLPPPDVPGARGLLDDELVVGRASRVRPRAADQRTVHGHDAFGAADGMLVEDRSRKVEMDGLARMDSQCLQPRTGLCLNRIHVSMTPVPQLDAGSI